MPCPEAQPDVPQLRRSGSHTKQCTRVVSHNAHQLSDQDMLRQTDCAVPSRLCDMHRHLLLTGNAGPMRGLSTAGLPARQRHKQELHAQVVLESRARLLRMRPQKGKVDTLSVSARLMR